MQRVLLPIRTIRQPCYTRSSHSVSHFFIGAAVLALSPPQCSDRSPMQAGRPPRTRRAWGRLSHVFNSAPQGRAEAN